MEEQTLIFVYGTLMRSGCRAHVLSRQTFLGESRTVAAYRLYDCGKYPGLVKVENGRSIHGELWSVDAACVRQLDQIEAVDEGLYVRAAIQLDPPPTGGEVQAYFYARSVDRLRDCGEQWINPV